MNYHQPRQIEPTADRPDAGKWRYTNMNDGFVWPEGYCAECPGHDTKEGAYEHQTQYVLTLVEPVIEWKRDDYGRFWHAHGWLASDDGRLDCFGMPVGHFDNPRAIAEVTQKMWNEARKN